MKSALAQQSDVVPDPHGVPRVAIVVLGMHQSGASIMAGVLSMLGARAPVHLVAAVDQHPGGFWEVPAVVALNEEILESQGPAWGALAGGALMFEEPRRLMLEHRAANVLVECFGSATLFTLEEPRLCRLWDVWGPALASLGVDARFVLPIRHPNAVVASLGAEADRPRAFASWLEHTLAAERASRPSPRALVTYDQLATDWPRVAAEIASALDLAWPRLIEEVEADITTFVTGACGEADAKARIVGVLGERWANQAFDALERASCMPRPVDETELTCLLDDLSANYREAFAMFSPLIERRRA